MSYRNPSQYVDRQTGQHYRNLINTISGVAEDIFESQRKKQAAISKQLKEAEETNRQEAKEQFKFENKASGALNNATPNIQGFVTNDISGSFSENIDIGGKLITKGINTKEEKTFLTNLNLLPDVMIRDGEAQEVLLGENGLKRAGQMGGPSLENDPNAVKWAQAATRKGPGKGELLFSYDLQTEGSPETSYGYKDETMDEPFVVTGSMLRTLAQDPSRSFLVTIPDETKNMQQVVQTFAFGQDAMGEVSKNLKSKYIENQPIKEEKLPSGDIRRYKETNEALLIEDMKPEIVATVESLPENQQAALLNYFLSKDEATADIKYDLNEPLDDEAKELLTLEYATYAVGKYAPPTQVDVEIIKAEKPKKPTVSEIKSKKQEDKLRKRAEDRLSAIKKGAKTAIRAALGEVEVAQEGTMIRLYPDTDDEQKYDMNRKEDIARLAKDLEVSEFGSDQQTDDVLILIDEIQERKRKERLEKEKNKLP